MRHFMAHDHGHFIVVQLQLIQDAGVKRNLSTGHAPCVDLLAANQIHFPLPFACIRVPLRCIGNQSGGDGAQAFELRVIVWRQRTFAVGFTQGLSVLLSGRSFQCFGWNKLAHARSLANINLCLRIASQQGCEPQASPAQLIQKNASRRSLCFSD